MADELNRFWIPIAQVLPIFILGLVVEARLALRPMSRKQRQRSRTGPLWVRIVDEVLQGLSGLIFVAAMVLLFLAFLIAISVLAGVLSPDLDTGGVWLASLLGAIFTGVLPLLRLLDKAVVQRWFDLWRDVRKPKKKE